MKMIDKRETQKTKENKTKTKTEKNKGLTQAILKG